GASANRGKYGNKAVRAYRARGYDVYPINPHAVEIEGLKAYPTLSTLPLEQLDRISIYLPQQTCLQVLPDLVNKTAREVWFSPGADSPVVLARARALGLPVIVGCAILDIGINPHDLDD